LKEFGSLKEIQKANINSISLVKGISKALAKDIKSKI
jgi:excinuclease UvrABC nuclease subunit